MTPHGPYAGVVDVARAAMNERIAEDAGLLYGLALPAEPTAEQLGWIKLQGEVL